MYTQAAFVNSQWYASFGIDSFTAMERLLFGKCSTEETGSFYANLPAEMLVDSVNSGTVDFAQHVDATLSRLIHLYWGRIKKPKEMKLFWKNLCDVVCDATAKKVLTKAFFLVSRNHRENSSYLRTLFMNGSGGILDHYEGAFDSGGENDNDG
jgi:hypothetical protein